MVTALSYSEREFFIVSMPASTLYLVCGVGWCVTVSRRPDNEESHPELKKLLTTWRLWTLG